MFLPSHRLTQVLRSKGGIRFRGRLTQVLRSKGGLIGFFIGCIWRDSVGRWNLSPPRGGLSQSAPEGGPCPGFRPGLALAPLYLISSSNLCYSRALSPTSTPAIVGPLKPDKQAPSSTQQHPAALSSTQQHSGCEPGLGPGHSVVQGPRRRRARRPRRTARRASLDALRI